MADEELEVETPDVDAMSDAEVADLKSKMREPEAPEGEQKPEKTEAAKPVKDEEEKQEFVPHGQFHRERERRKEAERLSDVATRRLSELLEASRPPPVQQQQPVDQDPEPGDDEPLAQLAWNKRRVKRIEDYLIGRETQQRQVSEQEMAENTAINAVSSRFEQQKAEKPELQEAANYLAVSLAHEFATMGYQGISPTGQILPNSPVQYAVIDHIKKIAIHCYQNGVPIEAYYDNLARARGWRPKEQAGQNGQARNEDGTFKAQAERIDNLERTKQKAKSLGGSGAPVEMSEVTPEALVNMTDEDFAAYKNKYKGNAMRKAFGAMH